MKRRPTIPYVILAVSLLLTATATWVVAESAHIRDRDRFDNAVQSTRDRIESRLETYVALLRGGAGLFAASDSVTRADFHTYAERLDIQQRYPGIQGIGFSRRFNAEEQDRLIASMRAQGQVDFRTWPEVDTPQRDAILYLEPLDRRNQAAIGFNMYSEATRRDAMARARDGAAPALSGRVTLVQEIEGRQQAGFLVYLPVYRSGTWPASLADRRENLEGYVYAPFRADDLFAGIFGTEANPRAAFKIYDGTSTTPENLLHDSAVGGLTPERNPSFTGQTTLQFGGRTWTIALANTAFFTQGSRRAFVPMLAGAGLLFSLVLFWLSRALVRAEEAARESEKRQRTILESLPVGVFVADRTGRITFMNTASRQIWAGGDHVDLEGYVDYKGWRPETGHRLTAQEWSLARAVRGETTGNEVVDIETFGGTRKTILSAAFPLCDGQGAVETAVAVVVDITEQRRAEAALRDRERELRTMVDAIPQLAWMADETGSVFWYNQRWYEYTGTTLDEMEGRGWKKVHHPDYVDRVAALFQHHVETGVFWEDTFPLRSKDGEYRWFLSRAVPILDDDGHVSRWFGTNTDITEEIQAREAEARAIREQAAREAAEMREEEVRRYATELERSNRELQDFAYVASHDLQEPLRKISTFADLLRAEAGPALDGQGIQYLDRMQQAALRMSRLIKDLLAFSRVTTKAQAFEEVDLNAILADVLSDLEVRIQETQGTVQVETLPPVEGDPVQMRQLFQNLIGNALKFHRQDTPPVVTVTGALTNAPLHPGPGIGIGTGIGSGTGARPVLQIKVEDNGIGFDLKYLDRIFTPFQRLHGKEKYEGTGIGLAICRRIVERHGGTITASSIAGQGSTFHIVLPVRHPQSTASQAQPPSAA